MELNAYHTLESMIFVLPDGTVVDSSAPDAEERFGAEAPTVAQGLLELRDRVQADTGLCDRIRRKYRMKNTMGYSLNALLDHATPVAVLSHLMIGSEGTLGFISEAVLRTVPDYPLKHTGMLFFPDVPAACSAIVPLRESGARALEPLDRASLAAVVDRPGVPDRIPGLPAAAAALVLEYEYEESAESELTDRLAGCHDLRPALSLPSEPIFTRDPGQQADLWAVRKGLIPSVGAKRQRGTVMMHQVKRLVDPEGLLSPGVLINDDPKAHITHLKSLEPVEEMVDPCIECGFCERLCPSRDLTRTPRQRIVLRREMARLQREEPGSETLRQLESAFRYAAIETCAADRPDPARDGGGTDRGA